MRLSRKPYSIRLATRFLALAHQQFVSPVLGIAPSYLAVNNRILEEAQRQMEVLSQWKVESVVLYRWQWCIGAYFGEEACEYETHYSLSDEIDPDGWLKLLDHEPIKLIANVHKPTVSRVVWRQDSDIPRHLRDHRRWFRVEGAHQLTCHWVYGGAGELSSDYCEGQVFYQGWVETLLGRSDNVITIEQPTDAQMAEVIFEAGRSVEADEQSF